MRSPTWPALKIQRATSPIQAETAGRVRISRLVMGRDVQAGEVLLELDANPEQLLAQEERARVDAVVPQVQAIRAELGAINQSEDREREANRLAVDEARARFREADAIARLAEDDAARLARLLAGGAIATGISRWVGQKQSAAGLQLKACTLLCHGWNQSNTRGRASETRRVRGCTVKSATCRAREPLERRSSRNLNTTSSVE